ncbi:hypothetical protein HPB50_023597 [Hyalomma asiaticum]|uniref:Uncharacterized protein n=1 Tax=Hyalomma asiaticum TaxID=266040 RepID=A0ACB7T3P8_HYAAI|nr:hypothetical protein HPB50_023597 [Hyalomma asiaticum]
MDAKNAMLEKAPHRLTAEECISLILNGIEEDRLHKLVRDSRGSMSNLYAKCMNHKLINDEGWQPLLNLMYHVSLEGFPLTPPIHKTISAWETAPKLVRKTGTWALLSFGVTSHPMEATKGPWGHPRCSRPVPPALTSTKQ